MSLSLPAGRPQIHWSFAGKSVRGTQHVRLDLPNQDAWVPEILGDGQAAVVAVADGHGSDRCFRSDVGARLAVRCALDLLKAVVLPPPGAPPLEQAFALLPRKLTLLWLQRIREHQTENPFSAEDLLLLRPTGADTAASATAHSLPYGTTIVAVAVTQGHLLLLQLGDGEILVVNDHDDHPEVPMPEDTTLLANETTSLCMPNAHERFRARMIPFGDTPPRMVLASTDGYPNSFLTTSDFRRVGPDLREVIRRKGLDIVETELEGWLQEASRDGSGDDCTVGLIWREGPEAAA